MTDVCEKGTLFQVAILGLPVTVKTRASFNAHMV